MFSRPRPSIASLGLLALAGCAGTPGYPSLAPRAIEDLTLAEPSRPAPPPGTVAAVAQARYAPLVAAARDGDAQFKRMLDRARPLLERGHAAPVGSDAWGEAQQQLSRVQAARAPVAQALIALQAASEAPETRTDSGLNAAVADALAEVAAIDGQEAAAIAAVTPAQS